MAAVVEAEYVVSAVFEIWLEAVDISDAGVWAQCCDGRDDPFLREELGVAVAGDVEESSSGLIIVRL
jgi:hypothetical protein